MMTDSHQQLLGYLMDALEEDERRAVEKQLQDDPALRRELQRLRECMQPLAADREPIEPPCGLWQRTCRVVDVTSRVIPGGTLLRMSGWRLKDSVAAAVVLLAVCLVLFPAVNRSQFQAGVTGCQDNLRGLGQALLHFSEGQAGRFPQIPRRGNSAFAGAYATFLRDSGRLPDSSLLLCPAVAPSRQETLYIPSQQELQLAKGMRLVQLRRAMTGDYGYTLGILIDGKYLPAKNLGRPTHAIMADAPSPRLDGGPSSNHGGLGQNVLFEPGNVRFIRVRESSTGVDYYFLNDAGQVAPGVHIDDAVIGPSHARPVAWP